MGNQVNEESGSHVRYPFRKTQAIVYDRFPDLKVRNQIFIDLPNNDWLIKDHFIAQQKCLDVMGDYKGKICVAVYHGMGNNMICKRDDINQPIYCKSVGYYNVSAKEEMELEEFHKGYILM